MKVFYHNEPFKLPCALLTTVGGADELFATRTELVSRYSIVRIRVPVLRGNATGSRTVDTLLIQLGDAASAVSSDDPTVMHAIAAADDTGLIRMNVVIRKPCVPDNTFDNLSKQCHQYVMEALGAGNFCPEHRIKPGPVRQITWGGVGTQQFSAMILMKTTCADKATFRSGTNGVLLLTFGRGDATTAVLLPAKATLA